MLRIRLTRVGKKNSPSYRVVVADSKKAVKRKFIEVLGHYNPTLKPKEIVINKERSVFWMGNGAQPSDTVRNLMCDLGILDKKEKINKIYSKKLSKKASKEGPGESKVEKAEEAIEEKEQVDQTAEQQPKNVEAEAKNTEASEQEDPAQKEADEPKEKAEEK